VLNNGLDLFIEEELHLPHELFMVEYFKAFDQSHQFQKEKQLAVID
jgi:hypothetical protein